MVSLEEIKEQKIFENGLPKITKGNITINQEYFQKYNINFKFIKATDSTFFKKIAINIFEKYNYQNVFINNGNKIEVNRDGVRKSIDNIFKSKNQLELIKQHIIVFSNLGNIIEHSKLVSQSKETKGRIKINLWNYYFDGLYIDGELYYLEFDVRSLDNGKNQYRVQRLEKHKKVDFSTGESNNNIRGLPAFE